MLQLLINLGLDARFLQWRIIPPPLSIRFMNLSKRQASFSLSLLAFSLFASCFHPSNASDSVSSYASYGNWASAAAEDDDFQRRVNELRKQLKHDNNINNLSVKSATYYGEIFSGGYKIEGEDEYHALEGVVKLNVDFSNHTIKGTIDEMERHDKELNEFMSYKRPLNWKINIEESKISNGFFNGNLVLETENEKYNGNWQAWFSDFSGKTTVAPATVMGRLGITEGDMNLDAQFQTSTTY